MNHKMTRRMAILLLLCMLAGLTVTACAAGFTDSGTIGSPYREAVEEMSRHGVLNGFPDGAFRPEETLTLEQGAKIVTYMVLGEGVNGLICERAPFKDVAADRWSLPA